MKKYTFKIPILKKFLRRRSLLRSKEMIKYKKYLLLRQNLKLKRFFAKVILYGRKKKRKFRLKHLFKVKIKKIQYDKFILLKFLKYIKLVKSWNKKEKRFFLLLPLVTELIKVVKRPDWRFNSIKIIDEKTENYKIFKYKKYFRRLQYKKRQLKRIKKKINLKKKNMCLILMWHTWNNFYVVVTDLNGKVINYVTAGHISEYSNKRKKLSHYNVVNMMNTVIPILRELKIKKVRVHLRTAISLHVRKVISFLWRKRIRIEHIYMNRLLPHHFGQRRRKLKRL